MTSTEPAQTAGDRRSGKAMSVLPVAPGAALDGPVADSPILTAPPSQSNCLQPVAAWESACGFAGVRQQLLTNTIRYHVRRSPNRLHLSVRVLRFGLTRLLAGGRTVDAGFLERL